MKFELNVDQVVKYNLWRAEVAAKGVEKQKAEVKNPDYMHITCWEMGYPYTGAIGGEISFIFAPNGIGECVSAKDSVTGEEINLTDYESW